MCNVNWQYEQLRRHTIRQEEVRLEKSEAIAAFNQHLYLAETELEKIGGSKKDNAERVIDYLNMTVKFRYLQEPEKNTFRLTVMLWLKSY